MDADGAEESRSIAQFLYKLFQSVTDSKEITNTRSNAFDLKEKVENVTNSQLNQVSTFQCNICVDHVRGGVITICGHLYCWTCLWPELYQRDKPQCPRCLRPLMLHEDIIPFLSQGPYATSNDGAILAQPGHVPRPTGIYLRLPEYPRWFVIKFLKGSFGCVRHLSQTLFEMDEVFPGLMYLTKFLQFFELLCALLMGIIYFFLMIKF